MPHVRSLLTALSALLLGAVALLWACSPHHADIFAFRSPGGYLQGVASERGGILVFLSKIRLDGIYGIPNRWGNERVGDFAAFSLPADDFHNAYSLGANPSTFSFLGFYTSSGTWIIVAPPGDAYRWILVPYWFLLLVALIAPLQLLRNHYRARRRARMGLCKHCGYDLRASPQQCPECGAPAVMPASPERPGSSRRLSAMLFFKVLLSIIVVLLAVIAIELRRSAWRVPPQPRQAQLPFAEAKLNERIGAINLNNVPVQNAVKTLSGRCGINISVDWASVYGANWPPVGTHVVRLDMSDVPLWAALKALFDGGGASWDDSIHLAVVGNTIFVARGQNLAPSELSLCVYDVRDLLSDERWGRGSDPGTVAISKRQSTLIDAIRNYSTAGDWSPQPSVGASWMGGNMAIFSGDLIVVESSYGQRKTQEFLAQLRNPIMVTRE